MTNCIAGGFFLGLKVNGLIKSTAHPRAHTIALDGAGALSRQQAPEGRRPQKGSLGFSADDSFIIASGTNVISTRNCRGDGPLIDKAQVQSMLGKNGTARDA